MSTRARQEPLTHRANSSSAWHQGRHGLHVSLSVPRADVTAAWSARVARPLPGTPWLVFLVLVLMLAAGAPLSAQDEQLIISWIDSLGGRYVRNPSGEITAVDLRNAWVTDLDLQKLTQLPQLERINLAYTKITDLGLEQLIPLPQVKSLNLYYAEAVTDLGIAHLKHWRDLEYLNLRGTKVSSSLFEHLQAMAQLRFLDVGHSRVSDELFETLSELEQLEHLAFGGNKMSGDALPMLKLLPSLRSLSVGGQQRTDSGNWSVSVTDFNIEHISQLSQLQVLELGQTSVTDRGIARLAQLTELRSLDLHGTRVTGRGIAALAGLPQLEHLKLWRASGIDDSAVSALLKMRALSILELPETQISGTGLERLSEKQGLRQLLIGGVDVTPGQVEAFRRALPECHLSWWPKPEIDYQPAR